MNTGLYYSLGSPVSTKSFSRDSQGLRSERPQTDCVLEKASVPPDASII